MVASRQAVVLVCVAGFALGPRIATGLWIRSSRGSTWQAGAFPWMGQLAWSQKQKALLNFENATLTHNNLGGKGPDEGPEVMMISNTGLFGRRNVSLMISVAEGHDYEPVKPERNGVSNGVASINLKDGHETLLNVGIFDEKGAPLSIPRFFMTVLDIDSGSNGAGVEEVEFAGVHGYYVAPSANIIVQGSGDRGLDLRANVTGTERDNPLSPWDMRQDQLNKAAMVEFVNVSNFSMRLAISNQSGETGRNFQLAGISDLITAPFGPCSQGVSLNISNSTVVYNNLDGAEPTSQSMVFSNAVTFQGAGVDLVVEFVRGIYSPTNPSHNGKFGAFGQINMGPLDAAKFDFKFVKAGTSESIALPDFFLSFYDIDQTSDGYEKLTMFSESGAYFLSETTSLKPKVTESGKVSFVSSMYDSELNNSRALRDVNEDEAVTFYFKEAVSAFRIMYQTSAHSTGRTFQFGGPAKAACF